MEYSQSMDKSKRTYNLLIAAPALAVSEDIEILKKEPLYNLVFASKIDIVNDLLKSEKVDLLIIELDLPGLDITKLIIKLRSLDPEIPVLVLADCNGKRIGENLWNAGIDDGVCRPVTAIELKHRVTRSLKLRRLSQFCSKLESENKGLWKLSITDGLTKLTNRRHFNDMLRLEFSRAVRYGGTLGCILLDIDHFKKVNDVYGHLTGDRILQDIAKLIQDNIRRIDLPARYGGEEFVLLLPETSGEGLGIVAEKLRSAIASHDFRDYTDPENPGPEQVTISLGGANFPESKVTKPEDLVEKADQAMYEAKRSGRNRVVMH